MRLQSEFLGDARNLALLRLLQDNPRIGLAELARRIGMSRPAARERLLRLEEAGIIAGFRLDLDPAALGFPLAAYIRLRPAPGQLQKMARLAAEIPEIVECHRVTGEDCFIVRIHAASLNALERVLDRFLAYGQTTTSIIQSSPVPLRSLPLPDARR